VNTSARRFPSITNEGAIRPHEVAFQRWSSPDFGNMGGGFGGAYPRPDFGGVATMPEMPEAAATERADTMAAHHPPTFKVYTPAEVRRVPFRKSMPAYEEVHASDSDGVGASTLLKWTGIGIVAGLAVLTALIVVLNFGGDRFTSIDARSALMGNKTEATPAPPAKPTAIADAKPAPKTELELPATTKKTATTAKVAAKPTTKKR
jgi:hypothetical protein